MVEAIHPFLPETRRPRQIDPAHRPKPAEATDQRTVGRRAIEEEWSPDSFGQFSIGNPAADRVLQLVLDCLAGQRRLRLDRNAQVDAENLLEQHPADERARAGRVDMANFSLLQHALQGDGEASGPALECPMERVSVTFDVRDDIPLRMPQADTPAGCLTFGVHEDLDEAMWLALEGMLDELQRRGYQRKEALMLASLTVDLRITQIVNGTKGVHAILPHDVLQECPPSPNGC